MAAVVLPAATLHTTCVAVMGPGTWGSGVEEVQPTFERPTPEVAALARQFPASASNDPARESDPKTDPALPGPVTWSQWGSAGTLYLVDAPTTGAKRQRLFVEQGGSVREIGLPASHIVVRPQWLGERILYERWNPWAVPPVSKLRRYVASWLDPSLRPEASLYISSTDRDRWRYRMPGHSPRVSPDGRHVAVLRSGALLAGYFSVHLWTVDDDQAPAIVSLREHAQRGANSFSMAWAPDSKSLMIRGRTGGFSRRGSRDSGGPDGIEFKLLYVLNEQALYDLTLLLDS